MGSGYRQDRGESDFVYCSSLSRYVDIARVTPIRLTHADIPSIYLTPVLTRLFDMPFVVFQNSRLFVGVFPVICFPNAEFKITLLVGNFDRVLHRHHYWRAFGSYRFISPATIKT